jgi:hypothetical protein
MGRLPRFVPGLTADLNAPADDSGALLGRVMLQSKRQRWIAPTHSK